MDKEMWCCSVTKSCLTLCNPMDCSKPGFPVLHDLLEFAQVHVRWVGDAIQPPHPLSLPSPPVLNLSQQQDQTLKCVLYIHRAKQWWTLFSSWQSHGAPVKTVLLKVNPLLVCATVFFRYAIWGGIHGSVDTCIWRKYNYKQQFIKTATFQLDITCYRKFWHEVSKAPSRSHSIYLSDI